MTDTNYQKYMKILTENPNYETLATALNWLYNGASRHFGAKGANDKVRDIHNFVQQHATLNDPDIRIVEFHLTGYKVFNPLLLEDALKKIDIRSVCKIKDRWPLIIVYDAKAGPQPTTQYNDNVILGIRPKADNRSLYVTHMVEKGTRLNEMMEEKEAKDGEK
jgi:hypothetical protein